MAPSSCHRIGAFASHDSSAKPRVFQKQLVPAGDSSHVSACPEHPDVATSLNNLAELYRAQGQYANAQPLYQRALAIREKALGPEHPDVAQSLNNLALLYYAQGQYANAEPLFNRALAIWEKALGPEHLQRGAIHGKLRVPATKHGPSRGSNAF